MIYYNYSFNKRKLIGKLIEYNVIDGVIYNTLHVKKGKDTIEKLIQSSHGKPIIFDNPIYTSGDLLNRENIDERGLEKFIYSTTDILNNGVIKEIPKLWKQYLDETEQYNVQKVLGLPLDSIIIKDDDFDDLINHVPKANYNFLSTKFNWNDTEKDLNQKYEIIINYCEKMKIDKLLLTIKTNTQKQKLDPDLFNAILQKFKTKNIDVILHHSLGYFHNLQVENLAFSGHTQGNSISQDVAPFLENPSKGRTTIWFYSKHIMGKINKRGFEIEIAPFKNNRQTFNQNAWRVVNSIEGEINNVKAMTSGDKDMPETTLAEMTTALNIKEFLKLDASQRNHWNIQAYENYNSLGGDIKNRIMTSIGK